MQNKSSIVSALKGTATPMGWQDSPNKKYDILDNVNIVNKTRSGGGGESENELIGWLEIL